MKKLLYLTSAAFLAVAGPVPLLNYLNSSINLKSDDVTWYAPDKIENLIKDVNSSLGNVNWVNGVSPTLSQLTQTDYDKYFKDKEGVLKEIKEKSENQITVQTFENNYTNDTPNLQTFQTQSYEKQVTNTHTFSYQFSEKVSVETKVKVPFLANVDLKVEVGAEQKWTDTETTTEDLKYPSQSFVVKPHSIGTALYVIKQGTFFEDGMASYTVDLNDTIGSSYYWNSGSTEWLQKNMSIKDIIALLKDHGYGDQIKANASKFSVLTTDNPDNPTWATLNLPMSWQSQGGKLIVDLDEKPL